MRQQQRPLSATRQPPGRWLWQSLISPAKAARISQPQSKKRPLTQLAFRLSPLLLALSGYIASASAALPPPINAGSLNNQLRQQQTPPAPAPAAPDLILPGPDAPAARNPDSSTTVTLKKITFEGLEDSLVPESQLQTLIAPMLNRPLTFGDLQDLADIIKQRLRQSDMPLAKAILPPQTITDGQLRIQVILGHYDTPSVGNLSSARTSVVQHILETHAPRGRLVTQSALERTALLLNDLPGTQSRVTLQPGDAPGTSAIDTDIVNTTRIGGYVLLDNQGDATSGRSRLSLAGYANELIGIGDQLQISLLGAWEKAGVINGSIDYSALVNGYGTRVGANYSHLHYHYQFESFSFNGDSDNWALYLNHPLLRSARSRIDLRIEGGQQYLTDRYPQDFAATPEQSQGKRLIDSLGVSVKGSIASLKGGLTVFTLFGAAGDASYRKVGITDPTRAGTKGAFRRLNYQLSHQQALIGPLSVYASVSGQFSSHNMDSSQKLLLGGPDAVRAYDVGEGGVDQGGIATAEIRTLWHLPLTLPGGKPDLTFAVFFDQGWGEQFKHNPNGELGIGDNYLNLSGAGAYLSLALPGNYALSLTWARRTGANAGGTTQDDRQRIWLSAIKTF